MIIKWRAGIVAGVLLLVAGAAGLWTAELGLHTESVRVAGVPVRVVLPSDNVGSDATPMPAVVVAHGLAGSGRLMRPFADTLVRRGYVVALPDLAGHAGNTRPFTDIDEAVRDVEAVVRYLRGRPDVDPARIALLGHSMGASAVVYAGAADQRIAATVAISLGDDEAAALRPGPRNLMLIRGALETGLAAVTEAALANTDHGEQLAVPFVEHVGVLYADTTHRRAARWIDDGLGHRPDRPTVEAHRRVAGGAAILAGALLLVLATVLRRPRHPAMSATGSTPPPWLIAGVVASPVAAVIGGLIGVRLFPAVITGYLIGYFAAAGLTLTVAAVLAHRARPDRVTPQWTAYAAGLAVAAGAAVMVPIHLGLTEMVPHGAARWGLIAALTLATALLLYGASALGRLRWTVPALAAAGTPLPAAAVVGLAPGFLLVVTPMIAALFGVYLVVAWAVRRAGVPAWCAIPAGALIVAWPVAATLPLI